MRNTVLVLFLMIGAAACWAGTVNKGFDYAKGWEQIDQAYASEYPKTAVAKVDSLYQAAIRDKRVEDQIKALRYRMALESWISEDSDQKVFDMMADNIRRSSFPASALLHSILGEIYWSYYQNHFYSEAQRSETVDFKQDNISTWDMKKVAKAARNEFRLSLERSEELKFIPVTNYPLLIEQVESDGHSLRPTLFDLLAHRALEHLDEGQEGFSVLFDNYRMTDLALLAPAKDYFKIRIAPVDTTSGKYLTLKLYQELIQFHNKDIDQTALTVVDTERLAFVRRYLTGSASDAAYEQTLIKAIQQYNEQDESAIYTFLRAKLYHENLKYHGLPAFLIDDNANQTFALELCNVAANAFPDNYGGKSCEQLATFISHPELDYSLENIALPDKPIMLTLKLKNIDRVQVRMYKIPFMINPGVGLNGVYNYSDDSHTILKNLLKTKPVYETSFDGFNEGDFTRHSYEIALPALPVGFYLCIVSDDFNKPFDDQHLKFSSITCSNLTVLSSNATRTSLQITDRNTGRAVPNVTVSGYKTISDKLGNDRKTQLVWTATADKSGRYCATDSDYNRSQFIIISNGTDSLNSNYFGGYNNYNQNNIRITPRILLFTDRSIYRPGQTIYCKGLVFETDGEKYHKLLPNTNVTLSLRDSNGQLINSQELITNEFGSVNTTFTAPTGVLTGGMTINATTAGNGYGNADIRVEEYKRPKFEVTINKPKDTFKLEQNVTVTGKALAYAGFPVDRADVNYTISRAPKYSYWYWWWYYPAQGQAQTLESGNLTTDKQGNFTITFKATGDDSYDGYEGLYFVYKITATVTDINGETHSGEYDLNVGAKELVLNPIIDEYVAQDGQPLGMAIKATNLSGEKLVVKGKLIISRLKTPDHIQKPRNQDRYTYEAANGDAPDRNYLSRKDFLKFFPTSIYGDEDKVDTWKVAKQTWSGYFNTEKNDSLNLKEFKGWQSGMYRLEAISTWHGQEVKSVRYFTVLAPKQKQLPYKTADFFVPIKTDCQPGETALVLAGSSYKGITMRFEVEKQHKIVDSLTVVLNNQQRLFRIPVLESDRGGFYVHVSYWRDNRFYTHSQEIKVAWKNKQLDFEYLTFRDKLLPGTPEEWRLKLKDYTAGAASAEVLAGMYDASLDAFTPHKWTAEVYNSIYMSCGWQALTATQMQWGAGFHNNYYYESQEYPQPRFNSMNDFGKGINWNRRGGRNIVMSEDMMMAPGAPPSKMFMGKGVAPLAKEMSGSASDKSAENTLQVNGETPALPKPDLGEVSVRKNLQETAFFYPTLHTDEQGEVSISFTIPEALTRWKFQALAVTRDLKIGLTDKITVTQKPLMVIPNLPRFFREGDQITVSAKISALEQTQQIGQCRLYLVDALSNQSLEGLFKLTDAQKTFSVQPGESTVVEWTLYIPYGISAVSCKMVAQADKFSDGEENTIPVLTNRMLVTESLPLPVHGKSTKDFIFDKLLHSKDSPTLTNHRLTLEFTSNPAWYAVQALPYMMEYPYECNEQLFSRFYGNSLASHIANSNPRIHRVFEAWKNIPNPSDLMSNLEKNQELKAVVLEETPWVLDAKNEAQSKQRLGLLFDLNNMQNQLSNSLNKLKQNQSSSGAWSWFPGMPDSWWVTQYIVEGLGHLNKLGVQTALVDDDSRMIPNALNYLDEKILIDYNDIMAHANPESDHLGYLEMHYLYTRSFFSDITINDDVQKAVDYFHGQAVKYWTGKGLYCQAMLALAESRNGNKTMPAKVIKSLNEKAFHSEELGMYWKENTGGWYWYQAPIETQALLIEAYNEIANDNTGVDDMRTWLLKQKQTTNWKTTKATAEACYALLLSGTEWLDNDKQAEISVGGKLIDPSKLEGVSAEAGTGYFKTSWSGSDISAQQANISVTNPNPGPAWGAMYWQYFENLDKITFAETPLKLKKQLFIERISPKGTVIEPVSAKTVLSVGDKIIVRIELRTDRDMEYVHMKDMRSAGFEPINVLSTYKYQDGLGYYEATGDAATNFFIEYLAKGTYVFEYPLRVNNKGDFSNGITSIQSMYAPEFTAHSEGIRVEVK